MIWILDQQKFIIHQHFLTKIQTTLLCKWLTPSVQVTLKVRVFSKRPSVQVAYNSTQHVFEMFPVFSKVHAEWLP